MAWTCSGATHAELLDRLIVARLLRTASVKEAFRRVDRAWFLPPAARGHAYVDAPQPIGHRVTISAPHMHAMMAELLAEHAVPGARVLDVGSGSGYLVAVLASMVAPSGVVVGVEHIPALAESSAAAVKRHLPDLARLVRIVCADGRLGAPPLAGASAASAARGQVEQAASESALPLCFDAIHVGAAAPNIPDDLIAQLAPGGRMVIPVGPDGGVQELLVVDKSRGPQPTVTVTSEGGVRFVPLTSAAKQLG